MDCIGTTGHADTIVGLVLARGLEIPCSTKVELFEANTRQGEETVHLVGNHRELVGQQGRQPPALVMGVDLAVVVVRDSLEQGQRSRLIRQKTNKMLNGFSG